MSNPKYRWCGGHTARSGLSPRCLEILPMIGFGLTTKEISTALGITGKTVDEHLGKIRELFNLQERTEMTRLAIALGLIKP